MKIPEVIAELEKRKGILHNTRSLISCKIDDLEDEKNNIDADIDNIMDAVASLEALQVEVNTGDLK